jgi:hypothetical protein
MPWQHKLSIGLLILLCSCQQTDRQIALKSSTAVPLGKGYIIPVGTVGIVSIQSETSANYELKIIFPDLVSTQAGSQTPAKIRLKKLDRVRLKNSIELFNANGTAIDLPKILPVATEQWCTNDGGFHYRSIVKLSIPKAKLWQSIDRITKVEKFALFAVVGNLQNLQPLTKPFLKTTGTGKYQKITYTLIMEGKQSPSNRLVARVVERGNPLWDGCGDGEERPALILETAAGTSDLRCCGP